MIKPLIASLALSTLMLPSSMAKQPALDESWLLEVVKKVGVRIYTDSAVCDDNPKAFGFLKGNQMHLCSKPHNGSVEALKDTIRHEAWHVVQVCNGGPITPNAAEAIHHAYTAGWRGHGYHLDHFHHEAEAFYAAKTFSASQIGRAVIKACVSK